VQRPGRGGPAAEDVRQAGFTLVELMVTLAVAVILTVIAVPSFRNITLSNRLTTTANALVGAIDTARMEAVKRNASTQVCSNAASRNGSDALGEACGTNTGAVVALANGEASSVLAGMAGIHSPIRLNGDVQAIRFNAQGLGYKPDDPSAAPYTGPVADICTSALGSANHRVVTMAAGSIVQVDSSPDTPCND